LELHQNPPNCACLNLRAAGRHLTRCYDKVLAPSGLLSSQHSLLTYISSVDDCGAADIADFLTMDISTVTRNLRPLVAAGYVTVGATETDRRRRPLRITPKGKRALAAARPLWIKAQDTVAKKLGKQRYADLLKVLTELREFAE
jgi:DNA-binding MarR family transcriptional regulator